MAPKRLPQGSIKSPLSLPCAFLQCRKFRHVFGGPAGAIERQRPQDRCRRLERPLNCLGQHDGTFWAAERARIDHVNQPPFSEEPRSQRLLGLAFLGERHHHRPRARLQHIQNRIVASLA
jgi:hypothetical protein